MVRGGCEEDEVAIEEDNSMERLEERKDGSGVAVVEQCVLTYMENDGGFGSCLKWVPLMG